MLNELRHGLDRLEIRSRRVLVGISGGADSVALLLGLVELRDEFELKIFAAHLNHKLRGAESDADAQWVETFCQTLGVECALESEDVGSAHDEGSKTLEEMARIIRYEFFERIAEKLSCTEIAVAHTASDQAETVLHHIVRGSGLSGLRGIPWERPLGHGVRLVRPLLNVARENIEAWLAEREQRFRSDASNADPAMTRNRIRHELLPSLEENYNPQISQALVRLSQHAKDAEQSLQFFAEQVLAQSIRERSANFCRLDCDPFREVPIVFRRTCLATLWKQQNWPRQRMSFEHWERCANLIEQRRGRLTLPHSVMAVRQQNWLDLERSSPEC